MAFIKSSTLGGATDLRQALTKAIAISANFRRVSEALF